MKVHALPLAGLKLIELTLRADERGFFVERFQAARFAEHGLPTKFAQVNHSRSRPGVLRGLHYQYDPPQGKLVGVVRGRVWDVVADVRPASPTFGQTFGLEIDGEGGQLLWVPAGFAHGFCVLGNGPADVLYQVDAAYNPASEGGVRWDDPDLAVAWPVAEPLLSPKDRGLPSFAEYRRRPPPWR